MEILKKFTADTFIDQKLIVSRTEGFNCCNKRVSEYFYCN